MKTYDAIFFDLDHTLWDYETNSRLTLCELHEEFELMPAMGIPQNDFLHTFNKVNHALWDRYNRGEINRDHIREERFAQILRSWYVENDQLADTLSREYIHRCPQKTSLFPHAVEMLTYLSEKYRLFILTNGFDDVQEVKLTQAAIRPFFQQVITSETTGHRKPSREIFSHALSCAASTGDRCLMIGDNLQADIAGALNAGLHAAYFNPNGQRHALKPHYEISCLSEVRNIL